MLVFLIIVIGFYAVYTLVMLLLLTGWLKTSGFSPGQAVCTTFVTVVVPVRDEESNITRLLDCLVSQDFPEKLLEVLVADDHSSDQSATLIRTYAAKYSFIRYLPLEAEETGKKQAIAKAVRVAAGELIITTDADCAMGPKWLSSMVSFYQTKKPAMIIGPVMINYGHRFFGRIQSLEFTSLVATAAGSAGTGMPVMCNGANLAFTRSSYLADPDPSDSSYSSGDDILFMLKLKSRGERVVFLKSPEAMVLTVPCRNIFSLISQRRRWISKSSGYHDYFINLLAVLVFGANMTWPFLFALANLFPAFWPGFLLALSMKWLADFVLLAPAVSWFRQWNTMPWFFLIQLFYPLYILAVIPGMFGDKGYWKGRKVV
jgi:cellulose synthase/poly-beta-1,6-N-acetylglucosamine synthase-like glycosyltransferase